MKRKNLSIALTVVDAVLLVALCLIPGWHWAKILGIILSVVTLVPQFVKVRIVNDTEKESE